MRMLNFKIKGTAKNMKTKKKYLAGVLLEQVRLAELLVRHRLVLDVFGLHGVIERAQRLLEGILYINSNIKINSMVWTGAERGTFLYSGACSYTVWRYSNSE